MGLVPYPPCAGKTCRDIVYKKAWPELVGVEAWACKVKIERENPIVTVVTVPRQGGTIRPDFCCNRVYLFVDENHICYFVPTVG
ncbi:UNVERIFIED_CONTAM: hypothetical protein Sradi_1829200 [Sesamum radiatum]|uniref:Uncharacterized protein n=1 Tax=Sesamum radiatum TaxID=300843 RepID=A0AAW2TXI3_SESRA